MRLFIDTGEPRWIILKLDLSLLLLILDGQGRLQSAWVNLFCTYK